MAGHNKWSKIKRKKGKLDKQRGKIFTRFSKMITTIAKEGGHNIRHNPALKVIVDQAKNINLPKRVINRAINKAVGRGNDGQVFKEILYEAHSEKGIPLLILAVTDNKHRTVAEVRNLLNKYKGTLGKTGSVTWQFNKKGKVELKPIKIKMHKQFGQSPIEQKFTLEQVLTEILETPNIEDVIEKKIEQEIYLDIIVPFHKLQIINTIIKNYGYLITDKGVHYMYNQEIQFTEKQINNINDLTNNLHELDDIQDLWFPSALNDVTV